MFKRSRVIVLAALLVSSLSVPCSAADTAFKDAFENAFNGGMLGALVGGALLVFTKKPSDHLNYIYYGAAGGILGGAAYSLTKTSKSLVSIENGNVKVAIPVIVPELRQASVNGTSSVMLKAELISGTF